MDGKVIFDLCLVIINDYYNINYNIRLLLTMLYPLVSSYLSAIPFTFYTTEKEYTINSYSIEFRVYVEDYFSKNIKHYNQLAISHNFSGYTYSYNKDIWYKIEDNGYKFSFMTSVNKNNSIVYHKILYSGDYKDLYNLFKKHYSDNYDNYDTKENITITYSSREGDTKCGKLKCTKDIESTVILDDAILNNLYTDIDKFYSTKNEDAKKNKRRKRCYLFNGLPGTGKTSLIEDIAVKYKKDIAYLKLEGFSFANLMNAIRNFNNRIIVFEDLSHEVLCNASKVSTSTSENDKQQQQNGLSTQDLLNLFDGIISPFDENLIFITSNDLSGISKAMLRPGRIDYQIEFTYASKEQVNKIFNKYNIKDTKPDKYIGKFTTSEIINKIQINEIK